MGRKPVIRHFSSLLQSSQHDQVWFSRQKYLQSCGKYFWMILVTIILRRLKLMQWLSMGLILSLGYFTVGFCSFRSHFPWSLHFQDRDEKAFNFQEASHASPLTDLGNQESIHVSHVSPIFFDAMMLCFLCIVLSVSAPRVIQLQPPTWGFYPLGVSGLS